MAYLIRNVLPRDLGDLKILGSELSSVNFPGSIQDLRKVIQRSQKSFSGKLKNNKARAQFLFVLEDTETGRVVGTSKIFARHGTPQRPHVYFEVRQEKVASKTLSVKFLRKFYRLKSDTRGYTEVGGLVLDPHYRHRLEKLGKQLSLVRFMWMKAHPSWFTGRVIAELLPPLHPGTQSTLYEFYGQRLTRMPYRKADLLSFKNKEFILKLFPKSDLYHDILPKEVQEDIGKTGPGSEVARRLLISIGFKFANQIDPFDGGPYYTARLSNINTYQNTKAYTFGGIKEISTKRKALILIETKKGIRVMLSPLQINKGEVYLPEAEAEIINPDKNQKIYVYNW